MDQSCDRGSPCARAVGNQSDGRWAGGWRRRAGVTSVWSLIVTSPEGEIPTQALAGVEKHHHASARRSKPGRAISSREGGRMRRLYCRTRSLLPMGFTLSLVCFVLFMLPPRSGVRSASVSCAAGSSRPHAPLQSLALLVQLATAPRAGQTLGGLPGAHAIVWG